MHQYTYSIHEYISKSKNEQVGDCAQSITTNTARRISSHRRNRFSRSHFRILPHILSYQSHSIKAPHLSNPNSSNPYIYQILIFIQSHTNTTILKGHIIPIRLHVRSQAQAACTRQGTPHHPHLSTLIPSS